MFPSQSRSRKYLPLTLVLLLCVLIPSIHAFDGSQPLPRGMNQSTGINRMTPPPRENEVPEDRGVRMLRKDIDSEDRMVMKDMQKKEPTGSSILNGSCIGPTYGSNNFTPIVSPKPSGTNISNSEKPTIGKNLRKKPPRMRRENREELDERTFWHFFR